MFQYLHLKLIAQGTNKIHFTMHKYICITAYKGIIHTRQEIRCQGANNQKRKKKEKRISYKVPTKTHPYLYLIGSLEKLSRTGSRVFFSTEQRWGWISFIGAARSEFSSLEIFNQQGNKNVAVRRREWLRPGA